MDVGKGKRKRSDCGNDDRSPKRTRLDRDGQLRRAFIHNFKAMADNLSVTEILPELISKELVTTKEADEVNGEKTKARKNYRLLCTVYRKANADETRLVEFREALEKVNRDEPGCRLEHIIEGIRRDHPAPSTTEAVDSDLNQMLQINYRLIQCSVDAQHILPELISREVITVAQSEQVFSEATSETRTTCLLNLMESSDGNLCGTFFEVLESSEKLKLHRPSESPQQQPSEKCPEAVAFKRAMGKLGASLTEEDVNRLLLCLYARDIISKPMYDELSSVVSHRPVLVKRNKLLFHLENKIGKDPSVFTKLIEICSKELHLRESGDILRKFYEDSLPTEKLPLTVERDSKCTWSDEGLPPMPSEVPKLSQQLQELYTSHRLIHSQKWPYINGNGFINLAIIKRKERVTFATADPFTRETIERNEDIDSILKSKEQIEMNDVLKTESGGNTDRLQIVLVQGAPGVGKSTFALEMAKKCKEITYFRLVLLVQLRQPIAHNANNFDDLLQLYGCHEFTKQVSDFFIKQQGEGLLLILDGFDELPSSVTSSDNSIYIRLLQGEYLPKATIILTTRPSVISCIQRVCDTRVSKYIEIVGFLSPQIDEFAHKCLGNEQAKDFLQYVYSYPHIKSMMYIPLNTAIIVKLYCSIVKDSHKPLPMTLTQLYTEFCLHLLQCQVDTRYSEFEQQFPQQQLGFRSELECMPDEVQSQVKEIAKVAFEGITTQTVVFYNLPPDFDHMDLMTKCETLVHSRCKSNRSAASFNFLHLTVQEFLAAFHISCLPAVSQKELLELHHSKQHFSRVWRFLAGLTAFKNIEWKFFIGKMTTSRCGSDMQIFNSLLANCLYEAQDPSICEKAYSEGCTVYSPMSVTQYDYYSLGYCIANSPCSWKLCTIGGDGLAVIAAGIKSIKSDPKGKIELIKLSYNGERISDIHELPKCMRKDITEFNLGNCGLNKDACDSLASIISLYPNVNRLDIADNPFTEGGATKLLRSVSKLSKLTYLDLLHAKLSSEDLDALSVLITTTGTLKNLIVGSTTMLTSVVEKMLNVILVDSRLRNLSIMNLDLDEFAVQLRETLERNTTLDTLMLWDRSFCIEGCIEVVKALEKNQKLKSLTLMPWYKLHIPESLFKDNNRINWFYYPKQE